MQVHVKAPNLEFLYNTRCVLSLKWGIDFSKKIIVSAWMSLPDHIHGILNTLYLFTLQSVITSPWSDQRSHDIYSWQLEPVCCILPEWPGWESCGQQLFTLFSFLMHPNIHTCQHMLSTFKQIKNCSNIKQVLAWFHLFLPLPIKTRFQKPLAYALNKILATWLRDSQTAIHTS